MTGRNDPCPCGSGKKYKKCHGQALPAQPAAPGTDASRLLEKCRLLFEQKQFTAALDVARQIPKSAQGCRVQVDILVARREAGDLESAQQVIEQWKKIAPTDPEPWSRTLEIALSSGNQPAQHAALKKLQALSPQNPRTLYYEGLLAQLAGRLEIALKRQAEAARRQFPDYLAASWKVMAASKAFEIAAGKYPGSGDSSYARLLGKPQVVKALESSLRDWHAEQGQSVERTGPAERSVIASAWLKLSIAGMQGLINLEACQEYNAMALQLDPDLLSARSSELFCMNYDARMSAAEIYRRHCATGDWIAQRYPERKRRFFNSRVAYRPLKVAYLSSDFSHHPVAYFILPVLQHHNPARVRSYLYHTKESQDDFTARCRSAADQFLSVWDYDDQALASQIERDAIDILVDLNGASSGHRLSLLSQRAAPVQVTWLGYPNTTGLASVDYRVVDPITDPAPGAAALSREQLLYLPRLFSIFDPITPLPEVAPPPFEQNGHITFGSFNNVNKLTAGHLQLWAEILRQVPGSKLLFKYPSLDFQALREELLALMTRAGVDADRIQFQGLVHGRQEHLQSFAGIDIHLDSFPYHGTTTSCECLIMGVPMVTLVGADHRSRVGASLLHSVGHEEWAAGSAEEFVRIAVGLATDRQALAAIRSGLRAAVQGSALMDASAFTADLEQAYQACWERWCRQSGPVD